MGGILKYLDPLTWVGPNAYSHWWVALFHTVLFGFGAKFFSIFFMLFGFWLLARRENPVGFLVSILFSFFFAYIGGVYQLFH